MLTLNKTRPSDARRSVYRDGVGGGVELKGEGGVKTDGTRSSWCCREDVAEGECVCVFIVY